MNTHTDLELELDVDDETLQLRISISSPKNYYFEDEYDIPTLFEVSKTTDIEPHEIILRGLFLELQRLGVIVSYENEISIKNQVIDFCSNFLENNVE